MLHIALTLFIEGVSFKTAADESKSVTEEMTAPWRETILPTILSNYVLKDIFNVDDFGLFIKPRQAEQSISKVSSGLVESIARCV